MNKPCIRLVAILLPALAASNALATVWYVKANAAGTGDGTSWANAFTSLRTALSIAGPGDQVWVAVGTYRPGLSTQANSRSQTFTPNDGLTVLGGFAGTETLASQRNPRLNATILSGDLVGDDGPNFANRADNVYKVLTLSTVSGTTIDGFIISGGQADGSAGNDAGSAIRASGSDACVVLNCIIRDNFSMRGAVYCSAADISFFGCAIVGNACGNEPAGMLIQGSPAPVVRNCDLVANRSTLAGAHAAGMLALATAPSPLIQGCILWDNRTADTTSEATQIRFDADGANVDLNDIQGLSGFSFPTGNFAANPGFVNELGPDGIAGTADDDLRLRALSPCIDRLAASLLPPDTDDMNGNGNTAEAVPFDLAWQPRVHNDPGSSPAGAATVDVGAYEFQDTSCLGDLNGDGTVNTTDLAKLLSKFSLSVPAYLEGDFNGDGVVNTVDLALLLSRFGTMCPASS